MVSKITAGRSAFTLIELLIVVSIIALLLAMLIPSLRRARDLAKLSVCATNLSQLGVAITVYAEQNRDRIPHSPACGGPFDFLCADVATNQLWIGEENEGHPMQPIGLGLLIDKHARDRNTYFCPADNTNNRREELPRIGSEMDAYGSYTYRQLDQLPPGNLGLLTNLGVNHVDGRRVAVEALALDTNSLGPGPFYHTNHRSRRVNVLYRDRSVQCFANEDGMFSIPSEIFANPMNIFVRLDQILINADFGYRQDPRGAPELAMIP